VLRLRKSFDGFVFETSLRFHAASPASNQPGLRPTRGSGFGLVAETVVLGPGAEPADDDDVDDAHAAADVAAKAMEKNEVGLTSGIGNRE
jgi:hypothetical protein